MKSASIGPGCSEKKEFELARGLRVGFARAKRARARFWGFLAFFHGCLEDPLFEGWFVELYRGTAKRPVKAGVG